MIKRPIKALCPYKRLCRLWASLCVPYINKLLYGHLHCYKTYSVSVRAYIIISPNRKQTTVYAGFEIILIGYRPTAKCSLNHNAYIL